MISLTTYTNKYAQLLPTLHERARRLVVAADAKALGDGGITFCHRASKLDAKTIRRGIQELTESQALLPDRCRRPGGGRKRLIEKDPTLKTDLEKLADAHARGDPESPLQWMSASTRTLQEELARRRHRICFKSVAMLLNRFGYSLQANRKTREGTDHPDRDAQFRHINDQANAFLKIGNPVISVDTKKKELVGNYQNNGKTWLPKGKPVEVNMHDFPDKKLGKAVPYGIFDIGKNDGYVNVGITHDTGEFSVASIERWWQHLGKKRYPRAKRILITADGGGSNGYRVRLWKKELQRFSDATGRDITVCHYPPGTSKWNKIEHKLFSFISTNWKGKPLTSYQVIVNLIASTKTASGLKVYAALDTRTYALQQQVTDAEMLRLNVHPHAFHGEWNYTIKPRK